MDVHTHFLCTRVVRSNRIETGKVDVHISIFTYMHTYKDSAVATGTDTTASGNNVASVKEGRKLRKEGRKEGRKEVK